MISLRNEIELQSLDEVASALRVSTATLRRRLATLPDVQPVRLGRSIMFAPDDVERLLASLRVAVAPVKVEGGLPKPGRAPKGAVTVKLVAPGKRKGNKFYLIRGSVAGREVEETTGTADADAAAAILKRYVRDLSAWCDARALDTVADGPPKPKLPPAPPRDSLKVIPPGGRKGNRHFVAVATIDGVEHQRSTKTLDEAKALAMAQAFYAALRGRRLPRRGEPATFAQAALSYERLRRPGRDDARRIDALRDAIGDRLVAELKPADLIEAANGLCPGLKASTKNREALRPAASILHHAAEQGWCPWIRVKLFKEARPVTRAVSTDDATRLVRAAETDEQRLLLLWLFRQGPRITDALKIETAQLDLERGTVRWRIGKTDADVVDPLHDDVLRLLRKQPPTGDFVFPWRTRFGVYKWLRPLTKRVGVRFTPHMARHSIGKWLNEDGAGLRTIMDALHHADLKSSARYQSTDAAALLAATRRLPAIVEGEADPPAAPPPRRPAVVVQLDGFRRAREGQAAG